MCPFLQEPLSLTLGPLGQEHTAELPPYNARTVHCILTHALTVHAMSQLTIDLPSHIPADEARLLLSIKLYEAERISLGKAAELAGYSKRAFMEMLSKEGIPVINISPEDLDRELDN